MKSKHGSGQTRADSIVKRSWFLMVDLGAALSAASGAPSWAVSSADVATFTWHYTCTETRERQEASFCFECNEAKSYCSCILWSVCCRYCWYYTQKGKKNKIISWFVILPDFQHYYEVDCSNLIQSKTIWWQKISYISNSYDSPTSAKYHGPKKRQLLHLRALFPGNFKGLPQKQAGQHFKTSCSPIFFSNCNL